MGTFVRPTSLTQALECRAAGAEILAGGTDFWPMRAGKPAYGTPNSVILDLSALGDLRGIDRQSNVYRFGALTTWSEVAEAPLPPAFRALQMAAREVGGRQIQNRGTLAGNLCNASPAADGVPPLLALDAEVELTSVRGTRTLPLAEFLIGPRRTALRADEMLTALLIPIPQADARSHFIKLGARKYQLISIVMAAAVVRTDAGVVTTAAIAVGACSPVALRMSVLERAVVGSPVADLERHLKAAHLAGLAPIDDIRADAAYRRDAARIVTARLLTHFKGAA